MKARQPTSSGAGIPQQDDLSQLVFTEDIQDEANGYFEQVFLSLPINLFIIAFTDLQSRRLLNCDRSYRTSKEFQNLRKPERAQGNVEEEECSNKVLTYRCWHVL